MIDLLKCNKYARVNDILTTLSFLNVKANIKDSGVLV